MNFDNCGKDVHMENTINLSIKLFLKFNILKNKLS